MVMKSVYRKSARPSIPGYHENGALQLIVMSGTTFIAFHFVRVVMLIVGMQKTEVFNALFPNIGLSTIPVFKQKFWTIITYGWVHHGFFDWFTNMIWLYCFGSVLQALAGYRQLIPLFTYALIIGGCFYIGSEWMSHDTFGSPGVYFMGANAGIMALAIASLALNPRHRMHFSATFSVPLVLIVGIYVLLNILVYIPKQLNAMMLCLGGGLTGWGFTALLKAGLRPGEWVYDLWSNLEKMATPDDVALGEKKSNKRMEILRHMYEPKKGITQQRIDEILDKINDRGYHTLSGEEKDILLRASKDNEY